MTLDRTPVDLLTLAANLSEDLVSRMAHAVGWPKPYAIRRARRREKVPAKTPWRNHYVGNLDDVWRAGIEVGVVVEGESSAVPGSVFVVTDLGIVALRLRLQAEILAPRIAP